MSSRARRLDAAVTSVAFDWGGAHVPTDGGPAGLRQRLSRATDGSVLPVAADAAAIERDAFTKGYAQGERAGAEAAATRADAMLRRLSDTVEELQALRAEVIQRTERQIVELALAIARRVVLREVSLDPELVLTMARVALDRLADTATASIHLHPDDYAVAVGSGPGGLKPSAGVQIVADGSVRRGGCVVRSDVGAIDVAVDAQLEEVAQALLGEPRRESTGARAGDALLRV